MFRIQITSQELVRCHQRTAREWRIEEIRPGLQVVTVTNKVNDFNKARTKLSHRQISWMTSSFWRRNSNEKLPIITLSVLTLISLVGCNLGKNPYFFKMNRIKKINNIKIMRSLIYFWKKRYINTTRKIKLKKTLAVQ